MRFLREEHIVRARYLTGYLIPILLFLGLVWLATPTVAAAGTPRVEVCHFPPGNLDNYHTITISEKALSAHLAHGDLTGSCNALCADICNDGDTCTVDDTGDCEQDGCPAVRDPVDCDDGFACTTDSCDSTTGCIYEPIECVPTDLCHVAACDEISGGCMDVPVSCAEGETCDLVTGDCDEDVMTCFDLDSFAGTGETIAAVHQCVVSGCAPVTCGVVLDGWRGLHCNRQRIELLGDRGQPRGNLLRTRNTDLIL
jgi:hypothetical protein